MLAGLRRSRQHRRYLEKVKWDGQPGLRGSRLGRWGAGEKLRFVALMPGLSGSRHERAGVLRRRPVVRIGRPGRRPTHCVVRSLTVSSRSSGFRRPRSRICSHQNGVKNVMYALLTVRAAAARSNVAAMRVMATATEDR